MSTDRVIMFRALNGSGLNNSTRKRQQKIQPAATFSARNMRSKPHTLPSIAPCDGPTRTQVLLRMNDTMQRLDIEQLQVAEIVINAIARGKLTGKI